MCTTICIADADPCHNVTCHRYQKCQLDERGKPQCVCPDTCPSKDLPGKLPDRLSVLTKQHTVAVCGSNKRLYSSWCELQKHACLHQLDIVTTKLEFCLAAGASEKELDRSDRHQLKLSGPAKCGSQFCNQHAYCNNSGALPVCQCPEDCAQQGIARNRSALSHRSNCGLLSQRTSHLSVAVTIGIMQMNANCGEKLACGKSS